MFAKCGLSNIVPIWMQVIEVKGIDDPMVIDNLRRSEEKRCKQGLSEMFRVAAGLSI